MIWVIVGWFTDPRFYDGRLPNSGLRHFARTSKGSDLCTFCDMTRTTFTNMYFVLGLHTYSARPIILLHTGVFKKLVFWSTTICQPFPFLFSPCLVDSCSQFAKFSQPFFTLSCLRLWFRRIAVPALYVQSRTSDAIVKVFNYQTERKLTSDVDVDHVAQ